MCVLVAVLLLGVTGQLQGVVGPHCDHHEVGDEADKDAVIQQVEVEHGLPELNRQVSGEGGGEGDGDGPHLGPLVPHQSPTQWVREQFSLLVSDHQLERM